MVSSRKILAHPGRVAAYLDGTPGPPVTLELGLTTRCNRTCEDCPSGLGRPGLELTLSQAEPLLACLQGRTRGLLVTGGEPTLSPIFGSVLEKARRNYGFEDIIVVTNGSTLDSPGVAEPLTAFASAVRISLYDWTEESFEGLRPTLERIRRLREKADLGKRPLAIGTSALISVARDEALERLAEEVAAAGAHWIYFHPLCMREAAAAGLTRAALGDVLQRLRDCQTRFRDRLAVHFLAERFDDTEPEFSAYHAAYFILVVAADARRYLATEVKYRPAFALGELGRDALEDILHGERVRDLIARTKSEDYPGLGGRNRGVLYNTLIERLRRGDLSLEQARNGLPEAGFVFPHIL